MRSGADCHLWQVVNSRTMEKTTLYLSRELKARLRAEAQRGNASQAELIRQALERYLDQGERTLPKSIGSSRSDGALSAAESEAWLRRRLTDP